MLYRHHSDHHTMSLPETVESTQVIDYTLLLVWLIAISLDLRTPVMTHPWSSYHVNCDDSQDEARVVATDVI
jgi:hypothetical protein